MILKFYELKRNKKRRKESLNLTGVVDHVKKRFCFVSAEGMTEDIKVKDHNMNGAIHQDVVELHIINNFSSKECLNQGTELSSKIIQKIGARL